MKLGTCLGRALRLRCPNCGGSSLFRGVFAMHEACGACSYDFRREPGYYVGAMWLNYLMAVATGLPVGLLLVDRVRIEALVAGLAAWGVLCPVLLFRHSRALWLALDLWASGGER